MRRQSMLMAPCIATKADAEASEEHFDGKTTEYLRF